MAKNYFDQVDLKADFPSEEKKLLEKWEKEGLQTKYLQKNKDSDKYFSFLDGPITANGPMGVHHAWGRTYKDVWQRFKNMQGFKQRFQNGFDCQGLWVEVEVEKELQLKNKKDIENLVPGDKKASIAKFVDLCKERVKKYSDLQTEQTIRLGNFMDWDNSYFTMSDSNNYMIWHFLKKCFDEGLIYKGHDVVPWCPRCETAISQHEMLTEDYKEITHDSIFIQYPIDGKANSYLLVWTTTPWTLPGNVAVAIDPDKDYVEAEGEVPGNKYYLIKEAAERLKLKVIRTLKGKELVGLTYKSPFDSLPLVAKALKGYIHKVIATDNQILPISGEEGTGLVHVAPGQGSEDFILGKKEKLPIVNLIDDEAYYIEGLEEFSKQSAKKHPEIIIDFLKTKNFLFSTQKYTHRYPACWRCKTELVWKVADEWYISMDKKLEDKGKSLREMMKKVVSNIKWIPEFGLERELDWLGNMHDWLISKKNRYWGLALPIWECHKCKHFEIIGGKEELKEKAVSGWEIFEGHTPHKPWIDEVKIKCSQCGEAMNRILDVGNPWLDAGIVPFSTISKDNKSEPLYTKDRNEWLKWFPAEFITESFPGQFKNWFYSLIAMSTVLEDTEPYKTVLGFATLLGEDGRPMHKSWGNAIEFNEGADKIGVDVMRWMFVRQNPTDNMLFGYRTADETRRRFYIKLWNIYNFFISYANIDGWVPKKEKTGKESVLDKWILARFTETVENVTGSLEKYDAYIASGDIDKFVDDLSLWYVRRSRDRIGPAADNEEDRNAFYETTFYILSTLSGLMAPFMPFVSELMYQNLTKGESVHLTDWPKVKKLNDDDKKLISKMQSVRDFVEVVHSERKEEKLAVKQPLLSVEVTLPDTDIDEGLLDIAKEELNVKAIKLTKGDEIKAILDTSTTPELEEEAKARDLIRKIQEERKNLGLTLIEKVNVISSWIPSNPSLLMRVKKKTLSEEISSGEFKVTKI
jgi:isoleucyl-tRNA synthetase